MKPWTKVALVAFGYFAAFAVAAAALAVRLALTSGPDRQASSGMYAFGDASLFVAIFGFVSLLPSGLALFFLRARRVLWIVLSFLAIAVATTGLAAISAYAFARTADPRSALGEWAAFAPLRMLAAPLLAAAFLVGGVIAPHRPSRIALLTSCIMEVVVTAAMGLLWFNPFRFH